MTLTLARAATTPRAPRPAQPSARHLVHVLPGFGVGGIQIRLARLINALGGRFRHTILTINGQDGCRDRLDPALGVAIEAAPVKGGLFSRVDADAQRLASLRPDLLLTYNWGAIEWAMANRLLAHRRHIHAEDGFGPEEAERQLRRRIMLRRWALRRAETLIVPSRTLESIAIAQWRLPPERVRYVPNSIDADDFAATAAGAPLFARAADEIVIGTVAPLRPEKNLARLIRAFARIPAGAPLRLVLAGDGPERPALEALARSQNLSKRVLFLGPVREPQRALALFDIFALSSDTEQMPMTVLEAMAMGLPIAMASRTVIGICSVSEDSAKISNSASARCGSRTGPRKSTRLLRFWLRARASSAGRSGPSPARTRRRGAPAGMRAKARMSRAKFFSGRSGATVPMTISSAARANRGAPAAVAAKSSASMLFGT